MTATDLKPPRRGRKPTEWIRRSARTHAIALAVPPAPPRDNDSASPLDIVNWLIRRYCAAVEAEDSKGEAADGKRIDGALKAAAALARGAAPYYHRRMKPGDVPPGEATGRHEIVVSWTPPATLAHAFPPAVAPEERPDEA
jgi:hypothetical protein